MNLFTTDIYITRRQYLSDKVILAVSLGIIPVGGVLMHFNIFDLHTGKVIMLPTLLICTGYLILKQLLLNSKGTSKLTLFSDRLKVNDAIYGLHDLQELEIVYDSYAGENQYVDHPLSSGFSNTIRFIKDGKEYYYRFKVESIDHKINLKRIMTAWYANKVQFHESYLGSWTAKRTFALDFLDKMEREEFKKKYQIQSIKPFQYD